jgi:GT2 family glycosyltransferase
MVSTSVACNPFAKDYAEQAAIRAIQDYLDRNGIDATAEKGRFYTSYRVRYTLKEPLKVAIIMPTRNQLSFLKSAIDSIREKTTYNHYHLYIVDNNSDDPQTLVYLRELEKQDWATVIEYPKPFNFSAINNYAVSQVNDPVLLFLNNDVEMLHGQWLEAMVEHIQRPEIGVVGGKLYYPDGSIQHAGVILGIGGVAGHSHKGLPGSFLGYFGRAEIVHNVSAVTGACMMTRREVFDAAGGFDAENLSIAFNDVDFCLKVRELGYRVIYTPYSELIHHESKSRGYEDTEEKMHRFAREIAFCQQKWNGLLERDPYYNPNLTREHEDFSIKEGVL